MSETAVADAPVTTDAPVADAPVTPAAPVAAVIPTPAPTAYTLALPQDSTLDPAVLSRTEAIARTQGLTNEQAQAAVTLLNQEAATQRADLLKSYAPGGTAWTQQVDGWKAETAADASLGATPAERAATVQRGHQVFAKYGESHPEDGAKLTAFLNEQGLSEHPTLVRFFAWLGKSAGERALVKGSDAIRPGSSAVERKYQESGMNP